MMTRHPLTWRKNLTKAHLAAACCGATVAVLVLLAGLLLAPPRAWVQHLDSSVPADPQFVVTLIGNVWYRVTVGPLLDGVEALLDLPLTIGASIAAYGLTFPVIVRLTSAGLAGLLVATDLHGRIERMTMPRRAVNQVSGPRLLDGKAGVHAAKGQWFQRFGIADGVELAQGLIMPRLLEAEHILLLASTGGGKTTILQWLIGKALGRGDRTLVLDVKGDMTARLPVSSFALLSLEDERSVRWIPGADIVTGNDGAELAALLISDTSDPSWSAGARQVFAAAIAFLQAESRDTGRPWTWAALSDMMEQPVADLYRLIAQVDPVAAAFIDMDREETQKTAWSFYVVMLSQSRQQLRNLAQMGASGRPFSIRRWMQGQDRRQALIVRQSQRLPELSAAMSRFVLRIAADSAAERTADDAPPPTWFFLDELPQIGNSEAVPRLAAIGRSAGVRLVVALQSLAQLRDSYGADVAEHLLDNLSTKIVGRMSPGEGQKAAIAMIGEAGVTYRDPDSAGKLVERTLPLVDAQFVETELGRARDDGSRWMVRALLVGHGDVARLAWPIGIWPPVRPAFVAAGAKKKGRPADRSTS